MFLLDITSLKLSHISVENSTGYGMVGMNILGNSSISHSRFMFNNYYTLNSTNCSYGLGTCMGGNMFLQYGFVSTVAGSSNMISIDSCVFSDGVDVSKSLQRLSSGLSIMYYVNDAAHDQYKVDVSIHSVVSTRNIAKRGANFLFYLCGNIETIKIVNTTSSMANYLLSPNKPTYSAGFEVYYDVTEPSAQLTTTNRTLLHISGSNFRDNIGRGMSIRLYRGYNNVKNQVIISKCLFQRNRSPIGSGASIGQTLPSTSLTGLQVLVQDTNFTDDTMSEQIFNTNGFNVVAVYRLRNFRIINCTFARNKQTALQAFESILYFGGHVIFSENSGTLGGAMILQGGSIFYLIPHTHLEITNNHAKRGGGIYVEDQVAGTEIPCFFQQLNLQNRFSYIDAVITLENNTADEAGSAVYGGGIDECFLYTSNNLLIYYDRTVFTTIFKIHNNCSCLSASQVSSNPVAVNLCNYKILDNLSGSKVHKVDAYPGQRFRIPVVLYGQRNGSVPGIVRGEFVNKSRSAHFAPLQETQKTEYSCTNLAYTIFSTRWYELVQLRVDGVRYYEEESRVTVNVTLLPCPPGFELSNLTAQCECASLLNYKHILCNISGVTPLVQRTKSIWISTHPNGIDTLLHDNCPLDYCKPIPIWLQLNHSDEQCAYGRSGLLCGRCKSNLSVAMGTSKCLECTNTYLALLLPFSLAGLMLVLFLIVCNLTVSKGTINGLIFYGNIVRVNYAFFFSTPKTSALKVFQQMLAVFIAWLNLDLGIETCFFYDMDAYIQTWLQFAFPFYIWMIVGIIIYLSRRSIIIVNLVGSSAVSVLATLFLLSYAKLQRTVITVFSFTYLQNYYGDGRSLAVWLYDGNVPFLQGKHIALFLMALAVTVVFILPFTLLLLFAPCIQASNHFLFKQVKMKLLPLLDAYQAPYKDKFRFWTGLMLVVRSVLLVGFGLNILGDSDINHLLTVTVLSILLGYTGITGIAYKNTTLNILETSFLINLLLLSGWTIYNRHTSNEDSSDGQSALVCTSTGVAFTTFICILFYHTCVLTKLHFNRHKEGGQKGDRGYERFCAIFSRCSTTSYHDCGRAERIPTQKSNFIIKAYVRICSYIEFRIYIGYALVKYS